MQVRHQLLRVHPKGDSPLGPYENYWSEVCTVTHFTAPSLPESAPTPLRLRHDSGAA